MPFRRRDGKFRLSGAGASNAMPACSLGRRSLLALTTALGIVLMFADRPSARFSVPEAPVATAARIVCLIPAVTEMLFAIGAGPQVIAVSSFDDYPPEVRELQRVGALLDPDLERILSLRPDLVIAYSTQTDLLQQLDRANIPTFAYQHGGLPDIMETIRQLGVRVGRDADAEVVVHRISEQITAIRGRVTGRARPRTLVVLAREALALRGIYASGGVGFLHDMLEVAGGENVFADVRRESVQVTSELVLARQPEVILEVRGSHMPADQQSRELAVWRRLPAVAAVRSGRVTMITDPRTVVPGPRVAEGTELLARALHPDAFR